MAGLTIKISADTQSAITQFNELGDSQNRFVKSLEDADKALGKANLDAFADKQALARAAITATRGETEALSSSVKAYQNKIESLIKQGISPENEEVQKLVKEEERLKKELEDTAAAHKLQENAAKGAATALAAIAAATGAAIAGAVKAAAKVEDMRAAYTTLLGSQEKAAELVKRINKEAATTPFEIESISASMNKLLPLFKGNSDAAVKAFRMIGDTAGGNAEKLATLTDAYAKVQMKGKASMSELNRISNAGVPIFDALSQKFGITAEELFEMSKNGDITAEHLTDAFKSMTSEGGTFFNGMENSSDTFNMRLLGLQENVGLVAAEIGEKFLPGLKDVLGAAGDAVAEFSEWIGEGDNLDRMLSAVGYALAGVTSGLAAFLVVSKGAAVINALTVAFKALTGAIAANPIGAIAVAVTAILIPALIALYKNWDTVVTYIAQGIARIEYFFKTVGSVMKEVFIVSVNTIKTAFFSLVEFIQKNLLGAVSNLLGALEKIPLVGKAFEGASSAVARFSQGITDITEAHKKEAQQAIAAAHAEQDAAQEAYNKKLVLIDSESKAKRAAIEEAKKSAKEEGDAELEAINEVIEAETEAARESVAAAAEAAAQKAVIAEAEAATLAQKLAGMKQTEAQYQQEAIGEFSKYLEDRMNAQFAADELDFEQQKLQAEAKKEFLAQQIAEIQAMEDFSDEEKLLAKQALAEQVKKIDKDVAENEKKLDEQRLAATKTLYSGMRDLLLAGLGETRAAAIAERIIASAEAGINTALAATKALASAPPPMNFAAAAGVVAAGVAQQIKIHSTPIPSAETGGRFIMPQTATGVDGGLLRMNQGEVADITPRGGVSEGGARIIINLDGRPIVDLMNVNLRSGDIYETSPAWA
jgi:tape measure domain-containing protein